MKIKLSAFIIIVFLIGIVCCLISIFANVIASAKTHVHDYGEWMTEESPSCTDKGKAVRYCDCGVNEERDVAALGHDGVCIDEKSADCASAGHKAYLLCKRCGFNTYEEIEQLGHDFDEWKITKESTCLNYGEEACTCLRNPLHIRTRQIEKTGHSIKEWTLERAATCETNGIEYAKCAVCSEKFTRETEAFGHAFGEWTLVAAQSCTADGEEKRVCKNNEKHFETRPLRATGHTPTGWLAESRATCTENGIEYKECSTCFKRLDEREIERYGHTPTGWLIEKQATCTENGIEYKECSTCFKRLDGREIERGGHTPTGWLTESRATCTADGVEYMQCLSCTLRLDERSVPATGHSFGEWATELAPSCTADGIEKRLCANDEAHFETRAVGKIAHSYAVLPIDENEHLSACKSCSNKLVEPHAWLNNECAVCGYKGASAEGLTFTLGGDGSYYIVTDAKNVASDTIEIPKFYNGVAVTALGENAFANFKGKGVVIPSAITQIARGAFAGCDNLQSLKLCFIGESREKPSNLSYVFGSAGIPTSLEAVELSDGITKLGDEAFKSCAFIKSIKLPSTLEILGRECFYGCTSLEEVVLPSNLKEIGSSAFWNCSSLKSIVIPASVVKIDLFAFNGIAAGATISFSDTDNWAIYSTNGKKADDLSREYISNTDAVIELNKSYILKKEEMGVI